MTGLGALLAAMAAAFRRFAGTKHPGAAMAATVADRIAALDTRAAREPLDRRPAPVGVDIEAIVATAEAGLEAPLARALRPITARVSWSQTYGEDQVGRGFVERAGFFDIASPERGLIATDALATGFMVMGPDLLYPVHYHPAEELYFVLTGKAEWRYGEEPWRAHPPGSLVFTPSMATHAIRSNDATLFLMYAWTGDLATSARLGRPT